MKDKPRASAEKDRRSPLSGDDPLGQHGANRVDRGREQGGLIGVGEHDTEVIRGEGARQTRSEVITQDTLVMSDVVIAWIGELGGALVVELGNDRANAGIRPIDSYF